ncbi:MAG: PorT family protein [Balneolia bacterium]|nr:PorT family protein [Balneolia bacterium]
MKKRTVSSFISALALLVVLSITNPAQAQFDQATFGAKAGFTAYSLTVDNGDSDTSDLRLGWTIGAFANIPLSSMFDFQPELYFTQKGGRDSFSEGGVDIEGNTILNYIEIPLLVRYNIPLETEVLPYITAGPTFGYLVSADQKIESDGASFTESIKDDLNALNVGLSVGIGLGLRQFSLDYRYEFGLTDLSDDDGLFGSDLSVKTSGFSVTLGYTF